MSLHFIPQPMRLEPKYYPNPEKTFTNPGAQPIGGPVIKRMLEQGGHWRKHKSADLYLKKPDGNPRSAAKGREYYPGEFFLDEPQPSISDQASSLTFLRMMFRAGWTSDEAAAWMQDTKEPGTHYWRWRAEHDEERYSFHSWGWREVQLTESNPYYKLPEGHLPFEPAAPPANTDQKPSIGVIQDWSTRPEEMDALLVYMLQNPGANRSELERASIWGIHPTRMLQVIRDTESKGLLGRRTVRTGRRGQPPKVWFVVGQQDPDEIVQMVEERYNPPAEEPVKKKRTRKPAWQQWRERDEEQLQEFRKASEERMSQKELIDQMLRDTFLRQEDLELVVC